MLSTNTLSVFILHHHHNEICNKNLYSIQDIMRASEPAAKKYKNVCDDFPNISILTKSATTGKFQLTFMHTTVGNKPLGESFVAFDLAGNIDSSSVVSINMYITFTTDGDKIRIPITGVLLRATAGNLARSKKQQDWTPRNAVLFLPLLMKAAILNRELDAGYLLKIFA